MSQSVQIKNLVGLIEKMQARAKRIMTAEFLFRGFGFALLFFLLTSLFIALGLSPIVGFFLFWLSSISFTGYLYWKYVRMPKTENALSPAKLAALAEERTPDLKGRFISAVEFAFALANPKTQPPYSVALASAEIEAVGGRVGLAMENRVISAKSAQWAMARFFGLLIAFSLTATLAPQPLERSAYALFLGDFGEHMKSDEMRFLAGDIDLTYNYPAYMGIEPLHVNNATGDIEAYPGTKISLGVTASIDADEGLLDMNQQADIALNHKSGQRFEGAFTVMQPDTYRFRFDGEEDHKTRSIKVMEDKKPFAAIEFPPVELEVRETDKIRMNYRLEDDFGVTEAELVFDYAAGKKRETKRIPLQAFAPAVKAKGEEYLWDLSGIQFEEGDRVAYHISVKDNDKVSGPKEGRSAIHYLKVFSIHEHHQKLIEAQEKILEAMIGLLAKHLENPLDEETLESAAMLVKKIEQTKTPVIETVTAPLEGLIEQLKEDPLSTEAVVALLSEIRFRFIRTLAAIETTENYLADMIDMHDPERMKPSHYLIRRFERDESALIETLERSIISLHELLQKQKYDALISDTEKLSDMRDRIRSMLNEYKKTGDPKLKEQIRQLLKEFQRRLAEIAKKMAQINKEMPEEFINPESMNTKAIEQNVENLEQMLDSGKLDDLDRALDELEAMSQQLNNMLDNLKEGSEKLGDDLYSEAMKDLMNFQKDVEQLQKKEENLHEQTKKIAENVKQRMQEQMKEDFDKKMKELAEQAKEAKKDIDKIATRRPSRQQADLKDMMKERLQNLEKALKAKDVDAAKSECNEAGRVMDSMEFDLKDPYDMRPSNSKSNKQALKHLEDAQRKTEGIKEALEQLAPSPEQMMSEKEKRMMEGLSQKQRELLREAMRLNQDAERLGGEMPFMPSETKGHMQKAAEGMDNARRTLRQKKANRSTGHQQQALHNLNQLQNALQQAMQAMQSGMQYGGMRPSMQQGPGRELSTEEVAIPKAEEYKTPKQLREDLLKAMKKKSPESYKPQTKEFYKELVK